MDLLQLDIQEVRSRPHFTEKGNDIRSWIEDVSCPDGLVVFIAHNGRRFDHRILKHHFEELGFPIPPNWLFADSIPLLKLRRPGLTKYNLKSLCLGELGELPAGLHHAEADVAALWAVMKKAFGQADDDASTKSVANACLTQCYGEAFQTVEEDGFEEQDFEM